MYLFTRRTKEVSFSWLCPRLMLAQKLKCLEPGRRAPSWRVCRQLKGAPLFIWISETLQSRSMWLFPEHIVISECDKQMLLMVKQTVFMKDFFLMKWQRRPAGSGAVCAVFCCLCVFRTEILAGRLAVTRENQALESGRKRAMSKNGKQRAPTSAFSYTLCK